MLVIVVAYYLVVALLLISYGIGRSDGYDAAMKKNGWRPTLNGWYKETPTKPPTKPPPLQPSLHDYVDPSDFE